MPDSPNELTVVTPYPGKSPQPSSNSEAMAMKRQLGGLRSYHLVTNDGDIVATLDIWYGPSQHVFMLLWDAENRRVDEVTVSYEELQNGDGVLERKMTEMLEHNGLRFITSLV